MEDDEFPFKDEYRLDLSNAVGALNIACINWMTISFGPVVGTLNYGGDAKPDQVFVVTGGGIGTIGLASAVQTGSSIKFTFASPVCEGGAPGKGDSSFLLGPGLQTATEERHPQPCTKPAAPRMSSRRAHRNRL